MEWKYSGIWGDEGLSDVAFGDQLMLGCWISPVIDISDAINSIDNVRSGIVYWHDSLLDFGESKAFYSIDNGETYIKAPEYEKDFGRVIIREISNDSLLRLKVILKNPYQDIFMDFPEIIRVTLLLSNVYADSIKSVTWDELVAFKHLALRSDGVYFEEGIRSSAPVSPWVNVTNEGISLKSGFYDELLVLPYIATEEQIKDWYIIDQPFFDQEEINYQNCYIEDLEDRITALENLIKQ